MTASLLPVVILDKLFLGCVRNRGQGRDDLLKDKLCALLQQLRKESNQLVTDSLNKVIYLNMFNKVMTAFC